MYHIGGSLTDLYTTQKPQMSGGDPLSAQDILNNVSNVESIPNVVNSEKVDPNLSTREEIHPAEMVDTVIEHARSIDQSAFSFSAIFNAFLAYTAKLIFVVFEIENKTIHNGILSFVWILMGGILFGIASTISNTNITFIMYCCALWIIALAVLFIFIQPYRVETAV